MKKRHIALLTASVITAALLGACGGKSADPTSAAGTETTAAAAGQSSEAAAETADEEKAADASAMDTTSLEELAEKAKGEEKLVIYSVSSVAEKIGDAFTEKYGIPVEFTQLSDSEMIEKVSGEAVAGVSGGADIILCQDGARVMAELISTGYVQNYLNDRIAAQVPEEWQNPLVHQFCNKVFIYNNENAGDDAYTNIWQFTDPQYKGILQMKDANSEGVNMNFFTMITRDDIAQQLAEAYKAYYGADISLTTENAGYEWIKMIYENGMVLGTSDTKVSEAVGAKGQSTSPVGLFTLNKYSKKDEKDLALAVADTVSPFAGFYYPIYVQTTSYSEHPNAAKLFTEFLFTEDGWAPFAKRIGDYSANLSLPAGPGDKSLDEWTNVLIPEDIEWVYEHRMDVEDFIQDIAY